jgi:hypothetical protein
MQTTNLVIHSIGKIHIIQIPRKPILGLDPALLLI